MAIISWKVAIFQTDFFLHILDLILPDYISKERNTQIFLNLEKIIAKEAKASVTDAGNCQCVSLLILMCKSSDPLPEALDL